MLEPKSKIECVHFWNFAHFAYFHVFGRSWSQKCQICEHLSIFALKKNMKFWLIFVKFRAGNFSRAVANFRPEPFSDFWPVQVPESAQNLALFWPPNFRSTPKNPRIYLDSSRPSLHDTPPKHVKTVRKNPQSRGPFLRLDRLFSGLFGSRRPPKTGPKSSFLALFGSLFARPASKNPCFPSPDGVERSSAWSRARNNSRFDPLRGSVELKK